MNIYGVRLPAMIITVLPYALLRLLLFCLVWLSHSRETINMIQSGRGLGRVAALFMVAGGFTVVLCIGLNYQWAPQSELAEKK